MNCRRVKCLWSDFVQLFQYNLILPTLTPQTVPVLGFVDSGSNDSIFKKSLSITFY